MPNKATKNRRRNIKQGMTLKIRASFLKIQTTHKGPDGKKVHETRNQLRKAISEATQAANWPDYLAKSGREKEFRIFVDNWRNGTLLKAA